MITLVAAWANPGAPSQLDRRVPALRGADLRSTNPKFRRAALPSRAPKHIPICWRPLGRLSLRPPTFPDTEVGPILGEVLILRPKNDPDGRGPLSRRFHPFRSTRKLTVGRVPIRHDARKAASLQATTSPTLFSMTERARFHAAAVPHFLPQMSP